MLVKMILPSGLNETWPQLDSAVITNCGSINQLGGGAYDIENLPVSPAATSNSPICGRVKIPQGERQERTDCYAEWLAFARRLAASLRR